jgi:hypothetical protein
MKRILLVVAALFAIEIAIPLEVGFAQDYLRGMTAKEMTLIHNDEGLPLEEVERRLSEIYTPEFWARERRIVAEREGRLFAEGAIFDNKLDRETADAVQREYDQKRLADTGDETLDRLRKEKSSRNPDELAAAPVRTAMRKAAFRTFLTLKAARSSGADKTNIKKVLADRELFDATFDGIHDEYSSSHNGKVQDFLQWLLDNSDSILSLITKIIAMFAADTSQVIQPVALASSGAMWAVVDQYDGTPPHLIRERRKVVAGTCNADGSGCSVGVVERTVIRGSACGLRDVRVRSLVKRLFSRVGARCGGC